MEAQSLLGEFAPDMFMQLSSLFSVPGLASQPCHLHGALAVKKEQEEEDDQYGASLSPSFFSADVVVVADEDAPNEEQAELLAHSRKEEEDEEEEDQEYKQEEDEEAEEEEAEVEIQQKKRGRKPGSTCSRKVRSKQDQTPRRFGRRGVIAPPLAEARRTPYTAIACVVCRQRKRKCDGKCPCSLCIKRGEVCQYGFPTKRQNSRAAAAADQNQMQKVLLEINHLHHQVRDLRSKVLPVANSAAAVCPAENSCSSDIAKAATAGQRCANECGSSSPASTSSSSRMIPLPFQKLESLHKRAEEAHHLISVQAAAEIYLAVYESVIPIISKEELIAGNYQNAKSTNNLAAFAVWNAVVLLGAKLLSQQQQFEDQEREPAHLPALAAVVRDALVELFDIASLDRSRALLLFSIYQLSLGENEKASWFIRSADALELSLPCHLSLSTSTLLEFASRGGLVSSWSHGFFSSEPVPAL